MNAFFVLIEIKSYEVHFLSKKLRMHCNFKFWILSNSFLRPGHNRSCIKWFAFLQFLKLFFFALIAIRSYKVLFFKNIPASTLQLQIMNVLKQFFKHREQEVICQIIFQHFYNDWTSFFGLTMIRSYKVQIYQKHAYECITTSNFELT